MCVCLYVSMYVCLCVPVSACVCLCVSVCACVRPHVWTKIGTTALFTLLQNKITQKYQPSDGTKPGISPPNF